MGRRVKQAGKSVALGLLLSLVLFGVALAAEKEEPVYSLGDIWDGISSFFDADKDPNPVKTIEKDEKTSSEEKKDGVIVAKRLDSAASSDKEKAPPKIEPYKVYQAPAVESEAPRKIGLSSLDEKNYAVSGSVAVFTGWDEASSSAAAAPVSALPSKFFPLFSAENRDSVQFLPLATSVDLEAMHPGVSRAIIAVHDVTRGAGEILAMLMTLGGADGGATVVLAPHFPLEVDIARFSAHLPEQGRVIARWPALRGWIDGGLSGGAGGISSFSALDFLALFLADKTRFPAMKTIVLAGYGAGGEFVQRYAAVGRAPELLAQDGVEVRFVVAQPSSYLYFSNLRPSDNGSAFSIPRDGGCPNFNSYPYGLENLGVYSRRKGVQALRIAYPLKRVYYLIGEESSGIAVDPFGDVSCAANLQGKGRFARAQAYARHIQQSFGEESAKTHIFSTVKNAAHDPVALFGSSCGLSALFGDGQCLPK